MPSILPSAATAYTGRQVLPTRAGAAGIAGQSGYGEPAASRRQALPDGFDASGYRPTHRLLDAATPASGDRRQGQQGGHGRRTVMAYATIAALTAPAQRHYHPGALLQVRA